MPSTHVLALSLFATAAAVGIAAASAQPPQQPPPRQRHEDGFGAVLWSVLDDCFFGDGDHAAAPAAVCLKSRALTALDRALGRPAVTVAEGVTLAARAGKSLAVDPEAERADRAALDAAPDADAKSALLDDMLASRVDRLVSTRTIVLDGAGQEGRKKKDKALQQAMMMAGMMAAGVVGPMALKVIALMAGKALLISKIALLLSGVIALKKLLQPQHSGGHEHIVEAAPSGHHYGRSVDAHRAPYSGQVQYSR